MVKFTETCFTNSSEVIVVFKDFIAVEYIVACITANKTRLLEATKCQPWLDG